MTPEEAELRRITSEIERNNAERDKFRRESELLKRNVGSKRLQKKVAFCILFSVIILVGFNRSLFDIDYSKLAAYFSDFTILDENDDGEQSVVSNLNSLISVTDAESIGTESIAETIFVENDEIIDVEELSHIIEKSNELDETEAQSYEQLLKENEALLKQLKEITSKKKTISEDNKILAKKNIYLNDQSNQLAQQAKMLARDKNNLEEKYRVLQNSRKKGSSKIKEMDQVSIVDAPVIKSQNDVKRPRTTDEIFDNAQKLLESTLDREEKLTKTLKLPTLEDKFNAKKLQARVMSTQDKIAQAASDVRLGVENPYKFIDGAKVLVQYPRHQDIDQVYKAMSAKFSEIGVRTTRQLTEQNKFLLTPAGTPREIDVTKLSFTLSHTSAKNEFEKASLIKQYLVEHGFNVTIWKTDIFPSLFLNTMVE